MPEAPTWKIDIKSLSTNEIVRLLGQLNESKFKEVTIDLRRELIQRARDEGTTDETIVRTLTRGVARGAKLDAVAKEWASVLGLSVKEFKRIANVK
jgi:DNA repair exonuclease SbcCD ATPase subunit